MAGRIQIRRRISEEAYESEANILAFLLQIDSAATRNDAVEFALNITKNTIRSRENIERKLSELGKNDSEG